MNMIKNYLTREFLSGATSSFIVTAFLIGMLVYPYTKIPSKVSNNIQQIDTLAKKTKQNNQEIKAIREELKSIDRTMRIIACSDGLKSETAQNFLNCSEFQ